MERVVEIVPEAGLHARPAAKFVETANEYDAEIHVAPVEAGEAGKPVAANSMIAVTSLGVKKGEEIQLSAEGADAAEALDALEAILSTPEGNEE